MPTYVLVHGGFTGGFRWRAVAALLRRAGHEVFTPTLTGLGERAHLARPEVDLDTHVADVVGVLECEDLSRVALVGHSSGSMVISGVAERVPERLAFLVYVDTVPPEDGESWLDLLGPEVAAYLLDLAERQGDGWRVPFPTPAPGAKSWPHPLKTVTQPLAVRNPAGAAVPRAFIHGTDKPGGTWLDPFWPRVARAAERARQAGWRYAELPTGHSPHLTMPEEFSRILLGLGEHEAGSR